MAALSSDSASALLFNDSENLKRTAVDSLDSLQENIALGCQGHKPAVPTQSTGAYINSAQEAVVDPSKTANTPQPQPTSMLRTRSSPESSNTLVSSTPLSESVIKSFLSTPGYLANRWNPANNSVSPPLSAQITPLVTPPM